MSANVKPTGLHESDESDKLAETIAAAYAAKQPISIQGGNSKPFLGEARSDDTQPLDVKRHAGVVSYEPGELVITARAGTLLSDVEARLASKDQRLAFEPPHFGDQATLGGTIATGVSGPARPYTGAARDFVLGCRIVNGKGQILRFGGEVMKNVAGYDLSRLMAGAHGTLGVVLDISLKVLPQPRARVTQVFEHDAEEALAAFSSWAAQPWPVSGAYWEDGKTYLRLSGADASVDSAREALGGETLADAGTFWQDLREHRRTFFTDDALPLWRLSSAPAARLADLPGKMSLDWGGAQRWVLSDAPAKTIRDAATAAGGHATLYRGDSQPRLHPLTPAMAAVQRRLKHAFDPAGILNPGRMGV